MTTKSVHVLVFPEFADWEPAFALAELKRSGKRSVVAVGFDLQPVTSMGGLRVVPDRKVDDIHAVESELLIIPGGDFWEGDYPRSTMNKLLSDFTAGGVPIAAICGATLALARAGLLNDRRHTSNMPGYITEHVPTYTGASLYQPLPAVTDRAVITASGLSPVEFAREIFRQLNVFKPEDDALWFEMFRHGRIPQSVSDRD